jgi:hypothetical protein
VDDALAPVDVRALERDPLLRPQAGADREERDRGEAGVELLRDCLDLGPGRERDDLRRLRLRILDVAGRALLEPFPPFRLGEHLLDGAEDVYDAAGLCLDGSFPVRRRIEAVWITRPTRQATRRRIGNTERGAVVQRARELVTTPADTATAPTSSSNY